MKAQVVENVTIAQAKTALEQTVKIYFTKDAQGNYCVDRRRARPVCLMGPAGIGKTEVVRQVAEEQGLAFLSYSITHHTRQSAIGLPKLTAMELNGTDVPVTEYTMSEIVAEVYNTMRKCGKDEGILFLDEFNCASETLRPVMLQLLQSKSFGPHMIPDGWMLVLAGNPSDYNVSAKALDAVTADRMRLLWLRPDYAVWRKYMVKNNIHPVVLSYLDDHKRHFYIFEKGQDGTGLVTARGWEDLSVMLGLMEKNGFSIDLPFVAQYLQSAQVARSFMSYYSQYVAIIESGAVKNIIEGVNGAEIGHLLDDMSFVQKWALTAAILVRLQNLRAECDEEFSIDAAMTLTRVIGFYNEYMDGEPQLEFLLNGITNSDECVRVIARHGCAAYSEAVKKVLFEYQPPSSRAVKKALENTADGDEE